jgi:predicted transposase/invertase (TIGR01784 family)
MDTGIAKAQEKIQLVLGDKEALRAYQMRAMAMSDYTSGINHARREGEKRGEKRGILLGEQRGEQKTQAKYVLKLSQKGMSAEEIAGLTDLPVEKVTNILT